MRIRTTAPHAPAAMLSVTAAAMLTLTACGSDGQASSQLASLDDTETAGNTDSADNADDGNTNDEASTPTTTIDPQLAMEQYEDCMADFGIITRVMSGDGSESGEATIEVTEDDQVAPPGPMSEDDFLAAEEECGPLLDDVFGDFELTPEQEAELDDQMLEFNRCMEDKGLGGLIREIGDVPDESIPMPQGDPAEFEAALAECNEVFDFEIDNDVSGGQS